MSNQHLGETDMPGQQVNVATQGEVDQCIALIVLAFSSDPAARWLYPDPSQFLAYFPRFVRAFGGKAFEHGWRTSLRFGSHRGFSLMRKSS
jgi:hypothetical protein